jgi:hypothetical protein
MRFFKTDYWYVGFQTGVLRLILECYDEYNNNNMKIIHRRYFNQQNTNLP